MKQKGNLSPLVGILILVIVAAVAFYIGTKNPNINNSSTTSTPVETPASQTVNWKTYVNTMYKYSIKYPDGFKTGNFDAVSGNLVPLSGIENKVGFYQHEDLFKNFLEIQVTDSKSTLEKLASANYKSNSEHFKTTQASALQQTQILNNPAYVYSYTGSSLTTDFWSGITPEGTYQVAFFSKNNLIYSIYYSKNQLTEEIFKSFELN